MNNLTFFIIFIILCLILKKNNLEKFVSEDCKNNCGTEKNPVNVPLPNCTSFCYTTSNDKNALKNCERNCGYENNPPKVPLPKCTEDCNTISKEKNALKNCKKHCNSKKIPAKVPLPKCIENCYTTNKNYIILIAIFSLIIIMIGIIIAMIV